MKTYIIALLLCAALLNEQTGFAETSKPMIDNVLSLAQATAILNVCIESTAYKKLSVEKALELHGLAIRLTDVAQKIAKHYNDDALYMTYEMTQIKMFSDSELKEYGRKEYQYCGNKLSTDMATFVVENEALIDSYLSKAGSTENKSVWPNAAKRSYVDRCTSSMESQGLASNYARPYCSCMTDGMETEFGMKEYDQMMKAQPNPAGSAYDQRLYEVFASCSHILPR